MKKSGFIVSMIGILLGAATLVMTSVINEVTPKIALIVFQTTTGSYTPIDFIMNFAFADTVAIVLIVCGLVFGAYCFVSEKRGG
ncbi:MAG: hypothetical protein FWC55_05820 [Firmicutes bacterium]|nr:hypothetical protein [Bacillota bacterium]